jgi:hypothetical protein
MGASSKDPDEKHVKVSFTMHPDLLALVDARAAELNETRSTFLAIAAEQRLGMVPQTLTQTDLDAIGEIVLKALKK